MRARLDSRVVRHFGGAALALLGLCACTAKPVDLGRDPDILWWTDHETGTLSDWQQGSYSEWLQDGGALAVDTVQARSGRFALDATAAAASAGATSAAMLLRTGDLPESAYYSAWFYVPTAIASADYWLIFKFRSRTPADAGAMDVELWDVDLTPQASDVQIRVFHHTSDSQATAGTQVDPIAPMPIPLGRWFQVEAFLRAVDDDSGRLTLWQDGALLYDIQGPSAPSSYVQWSAGSAAEALSSGQAKVYVDDAAISLRQLGPDFPPFWRGQ
ncbi:MAG TPA: heparin lyase I family protein [Polyangiaceae bacterium]